MAGSFREFGGGGNRVLRDEQQVAGHLLSEFVARAVQRAGQWVVDLRGAVVSAEMDDEVAHG